MSMKTKSIKTYQGLSDDPLWYKDAVIYEVRARSFYDSDGDGVGDFRGLAGKLDYLEDLGVTAIWMLPFYPSPSRDDGYDIADYYNVAPEAGTLQDFQYLLDEAHKRGIRVITELVINHTSDQHPWFQRARNSPPGSVERDFYVWSDSQEKYQDARIIFKDFEPSNWSWDPVAKAHYWHRFFHHQPDLNFESPAVQQAVFDVLDFWLGMGVDGLRLDAVPYLYEAEGTNCENLPQTHAFLKKLRAHVDQRHPGRMLLAEANQWPEDAAAYFGDGDECHMNFHFPIMPRMFMAIQMEDRFPIIDILAQTPMVHPSCQWAMFLRNHDELTLEMVTEEERDYMYRAYAHDPQMRINLGIRRRLAPLCGNDRRKMELLNGLLHALPGTPVLYYGDEIGMGDNVWLGDRNGVRTPMQWSSDRNAGFSRVNPQKLILPVVIDPDYHYESLNVDTQQNNPHSLLWWTKRIIALRKRFRAFGRGSIEFLNPANMRVLAFIREYEDETVLVVANLSRLVQYVELDLSKYRGGVPVEMFGRTKFPAIGELPYMLTLPGYGFYWFHVRRAQGGELTSRLSLHGPASIECTSTEKLLYGEERELLAQALPEFLGGRRWLDAPGRSVASATVVESIRLGVPNFTLALVRVEFDEGEPSTYVLPLVVVPEAGRAPGPLAVVATVRTMGSGSQPLRGWLVDALEEPAYSRAFFEALALKHSFTGLSGEATAQPIRDLPREVPEPRILTGEHRSAAILYGDKYVLKVFRRMEGGMSPELELGRKLVERNITPKLAGYIEYTPTRTGPARSEPITLAVLQEYAFNEGTAWTLTRSEVRRYYERVLTTYRSETITPRRDVHLLRRAREAPPREVAAAIGTFIAHVELLGRRTAELHLALSDPRDPAFAPETYSTFDQRSKYQSLRNLVGLVVRALRVAPVPAIAAPHATAVIQAETATIRRFEPLLSRRLSARRVRLHGDYHLGQVLHTGKDFVIIDLEGNPALTLVERRRKRSAMRDVASMVLSFQYAAYSAMFDESVVREADRALVLPWAHEWQTYVSAAFVRSYLETAAGAPFIAAEDDERELLYDASLVEAQMLAVRYELAHDTDKATSGVKIPLIALGLPLGIAT